MGDKSKTKEQLIKELALLRGLIAGLEEKEKKRRKIEEALLKSEEQYRSLVESTDDSIYLVDKNYRYVFMNNKHLSRLGLKEREQEGLAYSDIHSPEESAIFSERIDRVFDTGESIQSEYQSKKDGRYFLQTFSPVKKLSGKIVAVTVVSKDITKLKLMEEELRKLSLTDELTGLYNRRGFQTLADMQFHIANRLKQGIYLLYADLDKLKEINDRFGHNEGDRALIEAASILRNNYRKSDIIARIGGDEFVVLPVGSDSDTVGIIIRRLHEALGKYNAESGLGYKVWLSAGVAYYDPQKPCTVDEMLEQADKFMYEQKKRGQK
jgi:diguanylate cyclase (GGDEF)-like protein/PAS domain S-box-containing protein